MNFNKNQKKVINFGEGTLLVEAGPGSGKTTVIVERIKELIKKGVKPETFLVITFTRKAADNLQKKLKKKLNKEIVEKMQISTIHSFCLDFLKSKNQKINLLDDDSEERKALFIQKYKNQLGFKGNYPLRNYQISSVVEKFGEYPNFNVKSDEFIEYLENEKTFSQEYVNFINENKYFSSKKIKEEGYKDDWYNARYQQVARAYPKYLELLDKKSLVDYNTLQLKTLKELQSNPKTQYTTVLIDEFQDTDPLQFEIFKILRKYAEYFTAVGDIDQRIYSFRSTFKDYFDELQDSPDTARISLDCNYRSTSNIVEITDNFIEHQRTEMSQKDLKSANHEYNNESFIIETKQSNKRDKTAYENEAKKNFEIICKLDENNQIKCFNDIAVLYRKHSAKTIPYLIEYMQKAKIPFSVIGGSDLNDKKEVKAVLLMLWYITRKLDKSYISTAEEYDWLSLKGFYMKDFEGGFWSLTDHTKQYLKDLQETFEKEVIKFRNLKSPPKRKNTIKNFTGTKDETEKVLIEIFENVEKPVIDLDKIDGPDREFFEKLEFLRTQVNSEKPPEILKIFNCLLSMSNYFDDVKKYSSKVSNLAVLTQTMSNYESYISENDITGLFFFLNRVIRGYGSNYEDDNGVQLMTVHAAKGLEFPVTIVASLEKDEFPIKIKDPERTMQNIMYTDTFYTPNEYLEYKYFKDDEGEIRPISIEEENCRELEEEERVIYVAMTRAADLLILSCVGEIPECVCKIKPYLKEFSMDELKNVKIKKHFGKPEKENLVLNYSKYTKYLSCNFKYNLGYNLGFSRPGAKAANRGTVFHDIMEKINLKLKNSQEIDSEYIEKITREEYGSMFDIDKNPKEYTDFKTNVKKYYDTYSVNREVLEAELPFEIDRDTYILNGAIDLIYKINDDEIVILDYKYAK